MRGRKGLIGAGTLFFSCWGLGLVGLTVYLRELRVDLPPVSGEPRPAVSKPKPSSPWLSIPDRLRRGETLAAVLERNGFSSAEVHLVAQALSGQVNVRRLRAGDEVEIRYRHNGTLDSIRVHRGPLEIYEARPGPSGWVGDSVAVPVEKREAVLHGALKGSLFESIARLGETPALVVAFAEIFAWDFDFHTQSQQGDRFFLLVEKVYREGEFVTYGALRAARYVSGRTDLAAFLFDAGDGKIGYYDRDGKSTRKAFLRAPLQFNRISSRFSYNRLHPVHKRRMAHLGVDYAAPAGTAVHSVAAGVVVSLSSAGAAGNTVTLRHAHGYQSKYLHLSRFASGLRVGQRVAQKEVIGYVGSTGVATGPHLDFRLLRYGKAVDPLKQIYPPGPPVPEEAMPEFVETMTELQRKLDPSSTIGTQLADWEAGME